MLTFAQISDFHITTPARDPAHHARADERLIATLRAVRALRPAVAAILMTGDLTANGGADEYRRLMEILSAEGGDLPIYGAMGNHDLRGPALEVVGSPILKSDPNGFVQYEIMIGPVRVVVCDSLDEGKHSGAFCAKRAEWLRRTLDERPGTPTLVAIHHPPIPSGIAWMESDRDGDWTARLAGAVRHHPQVRGLICGHLHRPFHRLWQGVLVSVAPATTIQLALDLTPMDTQKPDGRALLLAEPPGFQLHVWDGDEFTAHIVQAGDFPVAVPFTHPFTP